MSLARPRRSAGLAGLLVALALALSWAAVGPARAAPAFPALTGRVVDKADILSPAVENQLTLDLARLETETRRQLVVVTLPSLQGLDIADYGYQLGRAWGIGQKAAPAPGGEKDNGVLLIVAPNDRKVRIEVGYGLEPVLTDALSSVILQTQVLPRFKAGDLSGGVVAGTEAIVQQLALPDAQARAKVEQASGAGAREDGGVWGLLPTLFIIIVLLSIFRGGRRGRRGAGWIAPVILGGLSQGGWGGRSSGGGFGSRGGGGFSGGGGGFGGGGASGGW
jgi:uncharacterized protein